MNNKGKRAVYFTTGDNYTKTEKKQILVNLLKLVEDVQLKLNSK